MKNDEGSPSLPRRPAQHHLLLLLILLAGFCLRIGRLGANSIWYDEAVSLHLAGKSIPAMLAHTAGDIHPPLYYALLHLWTQWAGTSEFAARFFSLLFGVLLIALTGRWTERLCNRSAGLLAAFLVAISPFHIWYSQEVRMYTLGAVLGLAATLALMRAIEAERDWRAWLCYILCGALGLYTLYYFAFLLIAVNLWALLRILRAGRRRPALLRWAGAQALVLILYAPWIPIALRQVTDPPVPPWRTWTPLGTVLSEAWTALSFGQSVEPAQVWPLLLITGALAIWGAVRLARRRADHAFLAAGYLLIPFGLILLFSLWTPLYHVRYLFTYAPAAAVLMAVGLDGFKGRSRPLGLLVLILIAGTSLFSLARYHFDPLYAPDDHRAAVGFLEERWRPGDAVLINAGYAYPAYLYYHQLPIAWRGRLTEYGSAFQREDAPDGLVLLQTGTLDGPSSLGWGQPTSDFYAMPRQEAFHALERLFADYDRVWVYRIYDTVTDPAGDIRSWLDEHGLKFEESPAFAGLSSMRVQGYLTRTSLPEAPPASALPLQASFNRRLKAEAVEMPAAALHGGEPLDVAVWWRALDPPLPTLGITLRLVDEGGGLWAQQDERPLGALFDTSRWPAEGLVRHPLRLHLPAGLPPGNYPLLLGVYEAESTTPWRTDAGEEFAQIGTLHVAPHLADIPPKRERLADFGDALALLRLEFPTEEVLAGYYVEFNSLWLALRPPEEDLVLFIQLLDSEGGLVAAQEAPPAGGRLPTTQLHQGQLLWEPRALHVPADTPAGRYRLIVGWYRAGDGQRLPVSTPGLLSSRHDHYPAGTITVRTRSPQLTPPFEPAQTLNAAPAPGIALVGYTLNARQAHAGGALELKLLWQAIGPIQGDFAVFCHLADEKGTILGQADGIPAGGTMPTLSWMHGEYIGDAYSIHLSEDAPPGEYHLWVGFYDPKTGQRPGNPVDVGVITVLP